MSAYTGMYEGSSGGPDGGAQQAHRRCGLGWRPTEILAMVLGFIVYWPIGLAILGWKVWQRKSGYRGDVAQFVQEKWQAHRSWHWQGAAQSGASGSGAWSHAGFGMRSTGNRAFDDWRRTELAKLEEERRKLAAAEREFADFMENLRHAKDREEFDRFMNARGNWKPSDSGPSHPAA